MSSDHRSSTSSPTAVNPINTSLPRASNSHNGSPAKSPLSPGARYQITPTSPVRIQSPRIQVQEASSAVMDTTDRRASALPTFDFDRSSSSAAPYSGTHVRNISAPMLEHMDTVSKTRKMQQDHLNSLNSDGPEPEQQDTQLMYHHEKLERDQKTKHAQQASRGTIGTTHSSSSDGNTASSTGEQAQGSPAQNTRPSPSLTRFNPNYDPAAASAAAARGRSLTPQGLRSDSPQPVGPYGRNLSVSSVGRMSDMRSPSVVDLLGNSYSQQQAHESHAQDASKLIGGPGARVAHVDTQKTLDMYRANVKKTNDSAVQYEFALFMVNTAMTMPGSANASRDPSPGPGGALNPSERKKELIKEAKQILQKLCDKSYPYAQYYLADGYNTGLFNNGKQDMASAFGLFVAAGKHGHAEASYRAALCYEFGWGCRKDVAKAVQFLRQSASKGHPGAATRMGKACLTGDMGLHGRDREGVTWLKRASEHADRQHNAGPYELALLHVHGYKADVFKDERFAAQQFTKAADLGNVAANMVMGEVYEHGNLGCPKDPALSIHFYNCAAEAGEPHAMMALCAWYMVGAEPVLVQDKGEAYAWAKRAAELELPKAEYTIGYFTEMGIGCRRDALEANVWYVRAADHGDERAAARLRVIHEAESGAPAGGSPNGGKKGGKGGLKKKKSAMDEKDCIVM